MIQTLPLPITSGVYRNTDGEALSDRNYSLLDGHLNELGYHVKRPGLGVFADLGGSTSPVSGLHWWPHSQIVLAVSNGAIYKIAESGGVSIVTALGGVSLSSGITTTFATDGTYAFLAAGGQIVYTNGIAAPAVIADGDAPTTVTHVDWLDGYLLAAGDGTNKFYWSDVNDSLSWTSTSFASAVGNADETVALKVFNREIYLFGEVSLEIWQNTGSRPNVFQRIPGAFFNVGCIAPYSVCHSKIGIFWLSDERQFVRYQGGAPETISTPYDREIEEMVSVSDCTGHAIKIHGVEFLIFNFQSAGRTLVFNTVNQTWSEWTYYNTGTGNVERFMGHTFCYAKQWGLHLIGSRSDSVVYETSLDNYDDVGEEIAFDLVTGHVDHGTLERKRCYELSMRVRRGRVELATEPVVMFRWRDNNRQTWSNWHEMSLGNIGESDIVLRAKNLGIYQTRQWQFRQTDSVPFVFGSVMEKFEVVQ